MFRAKIQRIDAKNCCLTTSKDLNSYSDSATPREGYNSTNIEGGNHESVIYQEIKAKGKEEGLQQKRQREATLILRLLNRRLAEVSDNVEAQIRRLPVEQLENSGEALLDFESEINLVNWLDRVE